MNIQPFKGHDGRYHYVYKVTNTINNKIYIGKHTTKILSDNYMGSGKRLHIAKRKYGKENFTKEYLSFHNNEQEAYDAEELLVTPDFIKEDNAYNIVIGGGTVRGLIHNEETKERIKQSCKKIVKTPEWISKINAANTGRPLSEEHKKSISNTLKGNKDSDEVRKKKSESNKGKPKSESHIENIRKALFSRPKIKCEYCDRELRIVNYNKWHGNKCKKKL